MSSKTIENQKSACTVTDDGMMRDEIFTFESFISWDLIEMGSLEDHKGFGALHPQFLGARTAIEYYTLKKNKMYQTDFIFAVSLRCIMIIVYYDY